MSLDCPDGWTDGLTRAMGKPSPGGEGRVRADVPPQFYRANQVLPDIIEIIPLDKPVRAEITVPGSKSITNRAMILAALAEGDVTLKGALWSEDTEAMFACLQKLGFEIRQEADPAEPCNRIITVQGRGGKIPNAGSPEKPLELYVANAGTAARFLAAFVCLGQGTYRLSGVPRMHERPQAALFQALRALGYRVDSENGNDKLPVRIHGEGPKPGHCRVSVAESSQFASALLLSASVGGWHVEREGENAEESPYVVMTERLVEAFPKHGGEFQIEPDASSGSYFWGAGWLMFVMKARLAALDKNQWHGSPVEVKNWPETGWQIDADFPHFLPFPARISRADQLADSIMTAIVLAADHEAGRGWGRMEDHHEIQFTELGRLRLQECERVLALRTELEKCRAMVVEAGDTMTIRPTVLSGAEIETYHDHRMAMCFAILGLKVPGLRIKNPACVKKTFPNFFQKLAAAPPHGLGAEIWEVKNAERTRRLAGSDLFAD
jgi:3-phosphoshikimate 1-carboxyvinyltransferase